MSYDGEKRLLSSASIANFEKQGITYATLNHKSVLVNESTIQTQRGFPFVKRNIISNRLYLTSTGKHILLLYIDKPLVISGVEVSV
jgi:hypothetical protein